MTETAPACAGRTERGDCETPPRYVVERDPARNTDTRPRFACGRHLGWLIDYRTTPGQRVIVTKLEDRRHGPVG